MSYRLKNSNLDVEVGNPSEFYDGSRFDLSGNIFQVVLNRKHTFCSTEKPVHHPDYGFGLVNEFDIEEPCNFPSAESGKFFHKIGVGSLLKEEDLPYNFFKKYPKASLDFSVSQIGETQLIFETFSPDIRGMKYEYRKSISIHENKLTIDYRLKNTGSENIKTTEYSHNFLAINQHPINESYKLKIRESIQPEHFIEKVNVNGNVSFNKNEMQWLVKPESDFFISGFCGKTGCFCWTLENIAEKAAVCETVDFECKQMNLWGTGHVVSPELYFKTEIRSGEEKTWQRKFTFFDW